MAGTAVHVYLYIYFEHNMRGDLNSKSCMSAHDVQAREITLLSIFGKRSKLTSDARVYMQ